MNDEEEAFRYWKASFFVFFEQSDIKVEKKAIHYRRQWSSTFPATGGLCIIFGVSS